MRHSTSSRSTIQTIIWLMLDSRVDCLCEGARKPWMTFVSWPVLTTIPSTYSELRSVEPRSSMLTTVSGTAGRPSMCSVPL